MDAFTDNLLKEHTGLKNHPMVFDMTFTYNILRFLGHLVEAPCFSQNR